MADCAVARRFVIAAILIIDDEEPVRQLLRQALEAAGHEVREASTGVEGLRAVCDRQTDLAITDIFMPDMDGLEMVHMLRREFPEVRIIAMSGGGGDWNAFKVARMLGAHDTLTKPVELSTLMERVGELLKPNN